MRFYFISLEARSIFQEKKFLPSEIIYFLYRIPYIHHKNILQYIDPRMLSPGNKSSEVLPLNFYILCYCGFWRPRINSVWKLSLYKFYTCVSVFLCYSIVIIKLVDIILYRMNNVDELIQNLYIFCDLFVFCCKCFILLSKQEKIRDIKKLLASEILEPKIKDEIRTQSKFVNRAR